MAMFKAYSSTAEVNGQTVSTIVDGMGAFRSRGIKMLEESGIHDLQVDGWYSQQAWLDAFKKIYELIGPNTVKQIGKKIPEKAQLPPGFDTIEKAMNLLDASYQMNHRNGDIGHIVYEQTGDRTGKITCPNPMPCEFELGAFEAFVDKFKADTVKPKVVHDPNSPCKKNGAESCTYHVTW